MSVEVQSVEGFSWQVASIQGCTVKFGHVSKEVGGAKQLSQNLQSLLFSRVPKKNRILSDTST